MALGSGVLAALVSLRWRLRDHKLPHYVSLGIIESVQYLSTWIESGGEHLYGLKALGLPPLSFHVDTVSGAVTPTFVEIYEEISHISLPPGRHRMPRAWHHVRHGLPRQTHTAYPAPLR